MNCEFSKLALGTRFRYLNSDRVLVKLEHLEGGFGLCAEWDTKQITTDWTSQSVLTFDPEECTPFGVVEVAELAAGERELLACDQCRKMVRNLWDGLCVECDEQIPDGLGGA